MTPRKETHHSLSHQSEEDEMWGQEGSKGGEEGGGVSQGIEGGSKRQRQRGWVGVAAVVGGLHNYSDNSWE